MNKPFIEKAPSILNRPDGSVLFECMIQASPQPEVKWFLKDEQIVTDDRHVMKVKKMVGKFTSTLIIKKPEQADQGIYKMVASNKYGETAVEQTYVAGCVSDSMVK